MQNTNHASNVFESHIEGEKFFKTIGEVSAELKISPHVLRFWESKFLVIKPHKRRGGHRYYSREDIEKISEIKFLLYEKGYTIKGAQRFIREKNKNNSSFYQEELEEDNNNDNMQSSLFEAAAQNESPEQKDNPVVNFRDTALTKIDKKLVMLFIKELESIKTLLQQV